MDKDAIRTIPWSEPLPPEAEAATTVVRTLAAAGHEAYLVGGAVRDLLLSRRPGDWDVATSATMEQIATLFPKVEFVGESFGVSLVKEAGIATETATFRSDGDYSDGRRPDSVRMPVSLLEDSRRRDFTVNALYLDPVAGRILDPQGGEEDCRRRLLRTVGKPGERFSEDALRLLRAPRLAASCDLTPVAETLAALSEHRDGLRRVAAERIGQEVSRILTGTNPARALDILADTGLLELILPEIEALRGVPQPPEFHPEGDVWTHTLSMLKHSPTRSLTLGLAILFHDAGKPLTISHGDRIRFNGHATKSAEILRAAGRRLCLPGGTVDRAAELVRQHMIFLDVRNMRPATLKRFLRQADFDELLELHHLDCLGSHGDLSQWNYCQQKREDFRREELYPSALLNGRDLMEMGYVAGPLFSEMLHALETAQLEGTLKDEAAARRWILERYPVGPELPEDQ